MCPYLSKTGQHVQLRQGRDHSLNRAGTHLSSWWLNLYHSIDISRQAHHFNDNNLTSCHTNNTQYFQPS